MVNRVIVLSNDVVPGCGVPVAAPGLRAHGLAVGLRSLGYSVTVVVPSHILERVWNSTTPPTLPPQTIELPADRVAEYLATQAPATVVFSNSNYVRSLEPNDDLRFVLDHFAPKMLETAYKFDHHPAKKLTNLGNAKRKAFQFADGLIINGQKKLPYALGWLMQTTHDPRTFPTAIVNMAVPGSDHVGSGGSQVRMGVAGYLQGWSMPGAWMDHLADHLEANPEQSFDVLLPSHWGDEKASLVSDRLDRIASLGNVRSHSVMRFHEFQAHLGSLDVVIDLFEHSLEREYAMVTRAVVALACGVPVIHPPFSEVSPFIEEYDAGWLIDAEDGDGFRKLISSITAEEATQKSKNAQRLHREVFTPETAAEPLKEIIDQLWESDESQDPS